MSRAITLAQAAGVAGEVPVGAVIVDASGNLIAEAENRREGQRPTAHAEIRSAGNWSSLAKAGTSTNAPLCHFRTLQCVRAITQARLGLWFMVLMTQRLEPFVLLTFDIAPALITICTRSILESACRQQLQGFTSRRLAAKLNSLMTLVEVPHRGANSDKENLR